MRLFLTALFLLAQTAGAATLTVHVKNVDPKGGTLRVSLYDAAGWTKDDDTPLASANVPAKAPETAVTLKDIKPGVYGVKLYQDTNNNEKFDQNFFGLPLERYGFSRDAKPVLSTPGFERTKFTIGEGDTEISITLQ